MIKRSTYITPKERDTHRLKGILGTYIWKVALEPESRTVQGIDTALFLAEE